MKKAETKKGLKNLTSTQKKLILKLFDNGMIKFGEFKFKLHDKHPDAPLAPFYIDLRMIRRFPKVKKLVIDVYQDLVKSLKFDLIADIPMASTPLVSSLSDRIRVGMVTPRGDNKAHGSGAKIDGVLPGDKGKKVVLIDDLVTQADSKLEAVKILEDFGFKIEDVVVLVDRQQGGREQLAQKGYKLHAGFTLDQMMSFYNEVGRLENSVYTDLMSRLDQLNQYLGVS